MSGSLDVAVVGAAGLMGKLIAGEFALHGHTVHMYDLDMARLEAAKQRVKYEIQALAFHDQATVEAAMGRLHVTTNLKTAVESADLVSECIVERLDVKVKVFQEILEHCKEDCVLSTNTMSMSIGEIAQKLKAPENLMGLRFLHPVLLIPDVEMTASVQTKPEILDQIKSLLLAMDKKPFYRAPGAGRYLKLTYEEAMAKRQAVIDKRHGELLVEEMKRSGLRAAEGEIADSVRELKDREDKFLTDDALCIICASAKKSALMYPCGHICSCFSCAMSIKQRQGTCPVCRQVIENVVRTFVV